MNYLEKIKELRISKGLSQYDMADKLNISQSSYYQIESGKTEMTLKRLYEIAGVLEVSAGKLLLEEMTESETHEYVEELIKTIKEQEETLAEQEKFMKFVYEHWTDSINSLNDMIDQVNELTPHKDIKYRHAPKPPKLKYWPKS